MRDRYGNKVSTFEIIMGMALSLLAILIIIFLGNIMLLTRDFTRPLPNYSHKTQQVKVNSSPDVSYIHHNTATNKVNKEPELLTDKQIHAIAIGQIKESLKKNK